MDLKTGGIRPTETFTVEALNVRRVFNSHVAATPEFEIRLADGRTGQAAPSQGETVGVYEERPGHVDRSVQQTALTRVVDEARGVPLTQADFDRLLLRHMEHVGRNACSALSEAAFRAQGWLETPLSNASMPRLCSNILNGGEHAYTNPVLSDFHEYVLVARSSDIDEVLAQHEEIQTLARERLACAETTVVAGYPVHRFSVADNRACIEFLLGLRDELGLRDAFDLYIDASAGDLRRDGHYEFALTDGRSRTSDEMVDYWLELERDYGLVFMEDPFAEDDLDSWSALTSRTSHGVVIGDNFYSTDAHRIRKGAAAGHANAAIIKPNQAGTVTAALEAIEACRDTGQTVITSHRSVSTESTFLSWLTVGHDVEFIKIGPLTTDYSSVLRLNAMLRLCETPHG